MVLLTGCTGYVGGRLLGALVGAGHRVRALARRPERLSGRIGPLVEVAPGDVFDTASLARAMAGIEAAYYLVHSMASGSRFAEEDRRASGNFAAAARRAGVKRIVYLGGLGTGPNLSEHLASRQEVGRILRDSGVPTIELRASIVIGSGSVSFDIIRALTDKLPAMVTPRWVHRMSQPIAIEDVIAYLVEALEIPCEESRVYEIGGADRASYVDIMREYARQRGLKRVMIPVPVLTPRLSSLWLSLVTPVHARVGRELIDGVRNDTVVTDGAAREIFRVRPRGLRDAIARALANEDCEIAETRWPDALSSCPPPRNWGGVRFGSRIVDSRTAEVSCLPLQAFRPIASIGGSTGWYYLGWLWKIRGALDKAAGGPGLRRGRRDPEHVRPGDALDFWRVEAVEPGRLLRLAAEMKLPGRAWLQFEVTPRPPSGATIRQTAIFDPLGFAGLLYWYALYPIHSLMFAGMLRGIAAAAERERH